MILIHDGYMIDPKSGILEIRDDFTTLRVLNSQAVWQPQEEFPPDH